MSARDAESSGSAAKAYRVAVLHQGFVPAYRERFFELLNQRSPHDYVIFHGEPPPNSGHVELPGPFNFPNVRVRNRQVGIGERLIVYQPVLWRILSGGFDALVVGHEFKFLSSMLLFGLFRAGGRPVLLWGHGYHRPDAAWLARCGSASLAQAADGYLAYSERGAARLYEAGVPPDRVTVVRNTIDVSREIAAQARLADVSPHQLKTAMGLRRDAQVLLYIGRLSRRKRVGDLIKLARRLEADPAVGPVDLLIAGDGPDRRQLEAEARGLGQVRFLGNVYQPDEVARLMRVAAATVIPGAVGLAANHSFAHGVPMITRRDDAHGPEIEFIRDGENGIVADGGFDAFAAAVGGYLRDRPRQERLAAAALRAREELGLEHMTEQFDMGVVRTIESASRQGVARPAEAQRRIDATGLKGWRR